MTTFRQPKTPFGAKSRTPDKSGMFFDETGTKKFALWPWLIGKYEDMFGKDSGEWSREQEKIFLDAVKRSDARDMEKLKLHEGEAEGKQMAEWKEWGGSTGDKTIWELYEDATPKEDTAGWNELDLIAEQNLNQQQADTGTDALVQSYQGSVYDVDAPDMVTQDSSKSKEVSPETAIKAAGLLNEMFNKPDEAPTQIRGAGVHSGRVPFPSLLASSQRQPDPRYVNKGLI